MERVTKKDADGNYYMSGDGIFSDWGVPEKFKGEDVDAVGTIEDILGDTYDLDRLRELVEADKDGRCVVLPCKVGTPVYWVVDVGVFECYFNLAAVEEVGKTVFLTREAAEAALAKEAK